MGHSTQFYSLKGSDMGIDLCVANLTPAFNCLLNSMLKELLVTFSLKEDMEKYIVSLVWTKKARGTRINPNNPAENCC